MPQPSVFGKYVWFPDDLVFIEKKNIYIYADISQALYVEEV